MNEDLSFTAEETEAEKIFDELHWNVDGGDPNDLQKILKSESELLHIEICDFLLQWEVENEEVRRQESQDEVLQKSLLTSPIGNTGNTGSNKNGKVDQQQSSSGHDSKSRVKETIALLLSLAQVDDELVAVDEWLGSQIDHLATVKLELAQIEKENSVLETSWHNLSSLKNVITALLNALHLPTEHEITLKNARKTVTVALQDKTLSRTDDILKSLLVAIEALRNCMNALKNGEFENGITEKDWQHITTLSIVIIQRKKISEISESLCQSLDDFSSTLFGTLLDHKFIVDAINSEALMSTVCLSKVTSITLVINEIKQLQELLYLPDGESRLSTLEMSKPNNNQSSQMVTHLMHAQRVFHEAIVPFTPLIEILSEFSLTLSQQFTQSYTISVTQKLYNIIIKQIFKDVQKYINPRQTTVTMASLPRCVLPNQMTAPTLQFRHMDNGSTKNTSLATTAAPPFISSWTALPVLVRLCEPLIEREDTFINQVFIYTYIYY
jgi:hypothetical protein